MTAWQWLVSGARSSNDENLLTPFNIIMAILLLLAVVSFIARVKNNNKIAQQIKQNNPYFHPEGFDLWVKDTFTKVITALNAQDIAALHSLEHDHLFEKHRQKLEEDKQRGQIEVGTFYKINQVNYIKYQIFAPYEYLVMEISVPMNIHLLDAATGTIVKTLSVIPDEGPANDRYIVTFKRRNDRLSNAAAGSASHCPYCDAPLHASHPGQQCTACSRMIPPDNSGWVLYDMLKR